MHSAAQERGHLEYSAPEITDKVGRRIFHQTVFFFSAFGTDLLQICTHSDLQYGARFSESVHLPLQW